eukprot:jgi/Mesvir1/23534/Mv18235-RA.1
MMKEPELERKEVHEERVVPVWRRHQWGLPQPPPKDFAPLPMPDPLMPLRAPVTFPIPDTSSTGSTPGELPKAAATVQRWAQGHSTTGRAYSDSSVQETAATGTGVMTVSAVNQAFMWSVRSNHGHAIPPSAPFPPSVPVAAPAGDPSHSDTVNMPWEAGGDIQPSTPPQKDAPPLATPATHGRQHAPPLVASTHSSPRSAHQPVGWCLALQVVLMYEPAWLCKVRELRKRYSREGALSSLIPWSELLLFVLFMEAFYGVSRLLCRAPNVRGSCVEGDALHTLNSMIVVACFSALVHSLARINTLDVLRPVYSVVFFAAILLFSLLGGDESIGSGLAPSVDNIADWRASQVIIMSVLLAVSTAAGIYHIVHAALSLPSRVEIGLYIGALVLAIGAMEFSYFYLWGEGLHLAYWFPFFLGACFAAFPTWPSALAQGFSLGVMTQGLASQGYAIFLDG